MVDGGTIATFVDEANKPGVEEPAPDDEELETDRAGTFVIGVVDRAVGPAGEEFFDATTSGKVTTGGAKISFVSAMIVARGICFTAGTGSAAAEGSA